MKRIILILIAVLIAPASIYAQKAYYKNGKVILDMTVVAGMPAGAVTNVTKISSSDSPSDTGPMLAENKQGEERNKQVFQKLEILKSSSDTEKTWVEAFEYCRDLDENGTGWRLPTQRELIMMWLFKYAFDNITGKFMVTYYWAATEEDVSTAWVVSFGNGETKSLAKTNSHYVRCVRETTD